MKINLASNELIHFVGIGGIGMSGLAMIMKGMGFKVQGSDISSNKNIERLKKEGIKVFVGHNKKNLKKTTLIVVSSAIKKNNPEFKKAKLDKIPIFKRGQMLANVISLKKNIIIAGSHGKTTTTSLISNILASAKLDPTVINGGVINSIKNNAQLGKGEWSVVESDESDGSFLDLPVTYSVITNIDKEHMDFYKNLNQLKVKFKALIDKTPTFGKSFICIDDKNIKDVVKKCSSMNYATYGFSKNANYYIHNVKNKKNFSLFDIKIKNKKSDVVLVKKIRLNLIGNHNVLNATAALAVSLNLGIKIKIIKNVFKKFKGIQRRFTKIFSHKGKDFYDDYAHHPTEITSLLKGARSAYPNRKIISVFQPHRYSRVSSLLNEFSKCFKLSNKVVLCPVYSAGEKKRKNFNLFKFAKLIGGRSKVQVIIIKNEYDLLKYLQKNLYFDELVICMGAGSISSWIRDIKTKYAYG